MKIVIQAIGIVAAILAILSYQSNRNTAIRVLKAFSELAFALQYYFLGAYPGMALVLLGAASEGVFSLVLSKNRSTVPWIVLFSAATVGLSVWTWTGLVTLLALAGKLLSVLAYGMKSPRLVRAVALPSQACWLAYDAICFSLGGILAETFGIVSILVAAFRFRNKDKEAPSGFPAETAAENPEEKTRDDDKNNRE